MQQSVSQCIARDPPTCATLSHTSVRASRRTTNLTSRILSGVSCLAVVAVHVRNRDLAIYPPLCRPCKTRTVNAVVAIEDALKNVTVMYPYPFLYCGASTCCQTISGNHAWDHVRELVHRSGDNGSFLVVVSAYLSRAPCRSQSVIASQPSSFSYHGSHHRRRRMGIISRHAKPGQFFSHAY